MTALRPLTRRSLLAGGVAALAGCRKQAPENSVTVYCSLDEPYSRPVLDAFTRETGIPVRAVFDTEATKSRGLAQRILAEKKAPLADVFWSSEVLQTVLLAGRGAFAPYRPPSAEPIPARFRDPQHRWTGFAARFRVFAVHRGTANPPRSLPDLTTPKWAGRLAMADPLFGTTTTEAAALFQLLSAEKARAFYRGLRDNRIRTVEGNSVAAEMAGTGEVAVALTDTDDGYLRQDAARLIDLLFPNQSPNAVPNGALLIPNTIGLIAGAPNLPGGKRFLDFVLRPETELMLANLPSRQLPLHPAARKSLPPAVRPLAKVKTMNVAYHQLADDYEAINAFLRETFGA
jgi:iron(III) transport system substrate-binding protein